MFFGLVATVGTDVRRDRAGPGGRMGRRHRCRVPGVLRCWSSTTCVTSPPTPWSASARSRCGWAIGGPVGCTSVLVGAARVAVAVRVPPDRRVVARRDRGHADRVARRSCRCCAGASGRGADPDARGDRARRNSRTACCSPWGSRSADPPVRALSRPRARRLHVGGLVAAVRRVRRARRPGSARKSAVGSRSAIRSADPVNLASRSPASNSTGTRFGRGGPRADDCAAGSGGAQAARQAGDGVACGGARADGVGEGGPLNIGAASHSSRNASTPICSIRSARVVVEATAFGPLVRARRARRRTDQHQPLDEVGACERCGQGEPPTHRVPDVGAGPTDVRRAAAAASSSASRSSG